MTRWPHDATHLHTVRYRRSGATRSRSDGSHGGTVQLGLLSPSGHHRCQTNPHLKSHTGRTAGVFAAPEGRTRAWMQIGPTFRWAGEPKNWLQQIHVVNETLTTGHIFFLWETGEWRHQKCVWTNVHQRLSLLLRGPPVATSLTALGLGSTFSTGPR